MKKLMIVSILCLCFMIIEVIGGSIAHSMAIMTDAAHLLSDFAGFLISILSIWIGTRPASKHMSYGYHWAEIIGALGSIVLIWGLTIWLIWEAIMRVIHPVEVNGKIMMIIAGIGLVFNLIMEKMLHIDGGNKESNDEKEHINQNNHKHENQFEQSNDHKNKL